MNQMTEPLCPNCKDPVSQHDSFYCLHVGCLCNMSQSTAQALYERDILQKKLDVAMGLIKVLRHNVFVEDTEDYKSFRKTIDDALAVIEEI
jgi:hypothetical protein